MGINDIDLVTFIEQVKNEIFSSQEYCVGSDAPAELTELEIEAKVVVKGVTATKLDLRIPFVGADLGDEHYQTVRLKLKPIRNAPPSGKYTKRIKIDDAGKVRLTTGAKVKKSGNALIQEHVDKARL